MGTSEAGSDSPSSKARPQRVNLFRQVRWVFVVGAVFATLYTAWTPLGLIPSGLAERINQSFSYSVDSQPAVWPTPTPRPRPGIGIVAGHWGSFEDPGAVCSDGLTEQQVNLEIATIVQQNLIAAGYDVDLLEEFDDRLVLYKALALVSIHADSCEFINNAATGFKVAGALQSANPERDERLVACLRARYQTATGMSFHPSVTNDMSFYHSFDELHTETAAAIIETGFLNRDREILTQNQEAIAKGISDGILCYINNESVTLPDAP